MGNMEDDVMNDVIKSMGGKLIGPNRWAIKRRPLEGEAYYEIFTERGRKLCTLTELELDALRSL